MLKCLHCSPCKEEILRPELLEVSENVKSSRELLWLVKWHKENLRDARRVEKTVQCFFSGF